MLIFWQVKLECVVVYGVLELVVLSPQPIVYCTNYLL